MQEYRLIENRVLLEFARERERQRVQEGYAPEHDDQHDATHWIALVATWLGRAGDAALEGDVGRYRRRLVQVGALALAAVETLDRQIVDPA